MTADTPKTPTAKRSAKQPKLTVVGGKTTTKAKTITGGTRRKSATQPSGITEKQETFAMAIFEGSNFSEAYRLAYDAERMSAACVHTEACLLVQHPKVSRRLEALHSDREAQQRMQALSRSDFVLKRLTDEAKNADNSDGARIRALELLGKSVALFTDKVETEDKTERDAETIKAELKSKLDRLMG